MYRAMSAFVIWRMGGGWGHLDEECDKGVRIKRKVPRASHDNIMLAALPPSPPAASNIPHRSHNILGGQQEACIKTATYLVSFFSRIIIVSLNINGSGVSTYNTLHVSPTHIVFLITSKFYVFKTKLRILSSL